MNSLPNLMANLLASQFTWSGDEPGIRYELSTLQSLADRPVWFAAAVVAFLLLLFAAGRWYWRERQSLSAPLAGLLMLLRMVALLAVIVLLLGPQRRAAEQQTRPSRVVAVVDASLSMAMPNQLQASTSAKPVSRSTAAVELLTTGGLIETLNDDHDVEVITNIAGGERQAFRQANLEATLEATLEANAQAATDEADLEEQPSESPAQRLANLAAPKSADSRLGDAIARVLEENQGQPLAGIVLLSDGQNNAGREPLLLAREAKQRGIVLHTVGFGSETASVNLAVRDILAPTRAYPQDEIKITALVELDGPADQLAASGPLKVTLSRRLADQPDSANRRVTEQAITSGESKEPIPVEFSVKPGETGRYVYSVDLPVVAGEQEAADNHREVEIEVIDRVLHVLLIAGGPTRDYRFVRDQLNRDKTFEVDVLLQSAPRGAQQNADEVLTEFPDTDEELSRYDAIVAFDAEWRKLSAEQQQMIDFAISQRGAGLLFVPGKVHTPRWLGERGASPLKSLLPVTLPSRWLAISSAEGPARRRSPVTLTSAGQQTDFLWIAGDRPASLEAWRTFGGFYSTFPVDSVKPGAITLAQLGKPTKRTGAGSKSAAKLDKVLLAEHYFGAGRVVFLASGEMWRLRADDPNYFTTFYTKLLQHLVQGRLMGNSPAGSLTFEQPRSQVGQTLVLRATMPQPATPAGEGVVAAATLNAQVVSPDGTVLDTPMSASQSQARVWVARWRATQEGIYRAVLPVTNGGPLTNGGQLAARAEVVVPALERSTRIRNVKNLQQLAAATGGHYYATAEQAIAGTDTLPALTEAIPSRRETKTIYGQPDVDFAAWLSQWVLGIVCGCLSFEWLLRRLNRLA